MSSAPSSALRLPFFSHQVKLHAPPCRFSPLTRAASSDNEPDTEPSSSDSDPFDSRLSQVRLRYKSGTGKKAEARRTKKGKNEGSKSTGGVFLPPVALAEPLSEGLNVEFGFTPYSERANGRIAALGITALLLVELATGESVIKYHSPSIIFVQIYFVAAVSAMYLKVEKEKLSVWPNS